MKFSFRTLLPVYIVFLLFLLLPLVLSSILLQFNIDKNVLIGANVLYLLITLLSFRIQKRGMLNKNPHVFVRSVTGGMMIKMFFCVIAVIMYVLASGSAFNKRAVFLSLLLYLVYLGTEVAVVMKMNKQHHA